MHVILLMDVPVPTIWDGDIFFLRKFSSQLFSLRMGGLTFVMFILRFFVFHLYESPKFLMGRGKNEAAVATVHAVAKYNGKTSNLQVEHLNVIDETYGRSESDTTAAAAVKRNLERFNLSHVRGLFHTRKLAFSTSLTILLWGLIGLAFPLYNAFLPYFLATRGAQTGTASIGLTYRNTVIIALMGLSSKYYAYIRYSRSLDCRFCSRTPSHWTQRGNVNSYRLNRSIPLLFHYRANIKCPTRMELRL
jgi:hypothetical protein